MLSTLSITLSNFDTHEPSGRAAAIGRYAPHSAVSCCTAPVPGELPAGARCRSKRAFNTVYCGETMDCGDGANSCAWRPAPNPCFIWQSASNDNVVIVRWVSAEPCLCRAVRRRPGEKTMVAQGGHHPLETRPGPLLQGRSAQGSSHRTGEPPAGWLTSGTAAQVKGTGLR